MSDPKGEVTAVPQEAIECPLCWIRRKEIHRLQYQGLGQWQCPACGTEVLAGDMDTPKPAVITEKYPNGDKAPKVKKWGGGRTGRRRRKPRQPVRWYQVAPIERTKKGPA